MRDSNISGVQIIFGHQAQVHQDYNSLEDAVNSWPLNEGVSYSSWNLSPEEEIQLTTFLSRLHNTAGAKNATTKPSLQNRIHSFLLVFTSLTLLQIPAKNDHNTTPKLFIPKNI